MRELNAGIFENSISLVGNTPLIQLKHVAGNLEAKVFVKAEFLNPSGSIKDRIALQIIKDAEKQGKIRPGISTIIEASTGNTGIALSYIGTMLGYTVRIYVPEGVSVERKKIMERYGAKVEVMGGEEEKRLKEKSISGGIVEIPGRLKCMDSEKRNQHLLGPPVQQLIDASLH